jgi:hypothetical protein
VSRLTPYHHALCMHSCHGACRHRGDFMLLSCYNIPSAKLVPFSLSVPVYVYIGKKALGRKEKMAKKFHAHSSRQNMGSAVG